MVQTENRIGYPEMTKKILILFLTIVLLGNQVQAMKIKPENPIRGDTVTIYGKSLPEKEVKVIVSFKKNLSVAEGRYMFKISGVEIPEEKNLFKIIAENCSELKVSVRLLNLVWVTVGSQAENGRAVVTHGNIPLGKYDILIHGSSDSSSVKLTIVAEGYVKADDSGLYQYSYDTSSIPPGKFVISAEGEELTVDLREKPSKSYPRPFPREMHGGNGEEEKPIETESNRSQSHKSTGNQTNETGDLDVKKYLSENEIKSPPKEENGAWEPKPSTPLPTPVPSLIHKPQIPETPTPETPANNSSPFKIPGFDWITWFLAFMVLIYLKGRRSP